LKNKTLAVEWEKQANEDKNTCENIVGGKAAFRAESNELYLFGGLNSGGVSRKFVFGEKKWD
jgi:hypothetical protein